VNKKLIALSLLIAIPNVYCIESSSQDYLKAVGGIAIVLGLCFAGHHYCHSQSNTNEPQNSSKKDAETNSSIKDDIRQEKSAPTLKKLIKDQEIHIAHPMVEPSGQLATPIESIVINAEPVALPKASNSKPTAEPSAQRKNDGIFMAHAIFAHALWLGNNSIKKDNLNELLNEQWN
jgi:hypothetical protein